MPSLQNLLMKAGGKKVYSALDAASAYHTVPLTRRSREMTAFSTPSGHYQYNRLPFGISTAPAIYSRFIAAVLAPLGTKRLNIYLDDILIFTDSLLDMVATLEQVFEKHAEAGILLNPSKTHLFRERVEYLGHMLSASGIEMVDDYVRKIVEWPTPVSVSQLNTFLGFTSYYRGFVENYSELTAEMNACKRMKMLTWTDSMEEDFRALKNLFREAPIRGVPDYGEKAEEFILTTDFSGKAVSAILSQVQGGRERLLVAGGRKTTKPEENYPSWKGELSALTFGLRKYEMILRFKKFRVITDSSALKYLKTMKQAKGIAGRWIEEIQSYQFDVVHRPGKDNLNADALSRADHLERATKREEEEQAEIIAVLEAGSDIDRSIIRDKQVEDADLSTIRRYISENYTPVEQDLQQSSKQLKTLCELLPSVKVAEDGVLEVTRTSINTLELGDRILMPESLWKKVFEYCHEHPTAGHWGVAGTVARVNSKFYMPGLLPYIKNEVSRCGTCLAKVKRVDLKAGHHVPSRGTYILETVFIDLVGPLPENNEDYTYILTIEDAFTRFVTAVPIRDKRSITVARVLLDRWISIFGCPYYIKSDQGTEFTSQVFKDLMTLLGIKKKVTPPYNPQSNPVERYHRSLNQLMRINLPREDKDWPRFLPACSLAYNTKVHSSTGCTPYFAFFGREATLPLDLIVSLPQPRTRSIAEHVSILWSRYSKIYQRMRKMGEITIRRNARQYSNKDPDFEPDTLVWYFSSRRIPQKPDKLTTSWTGPWKIIRRINQVMYLIKPAHTDTGRELTVHGAKLKPYDGDLINTGQGQIPRGMQEVEMDDDMAENVGPTTTSYAPPNTRIPVHVSSGNETLMTDLQTRPRDTVEEKLAEGGQTIPPEDEIMEEKQDADTEDKRDMEMTPVGSGRTSNSGSIEIRHDQEPEMDVQVDSERRDPTGSNNGEQVSGRMECESRGTRRARSSTSSSSEARSERPKRKFLQKAKETWRQARERTTVDNTSSSSDSNSRTKTRHPALLSSSDSEIDSLICCANTDAAIIFRLV